MGSRKFHKLPRLQKSDFMKLQTKLTLLQSKEFDESKYESFLTKKKQNNFAGFFLPTLFFLIHNHSRPTSAHFFLYVNCVKSANGALNNFYEPVKTYRTIYLEVMTVRTYAKKGKRDLHEKDKETRLNRIEKDITQRVK